MHRLEACHTPFKEEDLDWRMGIELDRISNRFQRRSEMHDARSKRVAGTILRMKQNRLRSALTTTLMTDIQKNTKVDLKTLNLVDPRTAPGYTMSQEEYLELNYELENGKLNIKKYRLLAQKVFVLLDTHCHGYIAIAELITRMTSDSYVLKNSNCKYYLFN